MDTLQLKITKIETVATDAILVSLQEVNLQPVHYEAGQFFTFIIDHYGREVRRSYSIATTPGIDQEMAVVIKRHVNGEISRYLTEHLQTGDILTALYPAGRFTIGTDPLNSRSVFFIAAGSGITPVYSLLRKVLYTETLSKAILVFQNRDEATTIFRNELGVLQEQFPDRFVLVTLLSNPKQKGHSCRRLNNSLLEELINSYHSFDGSDVFYLCGPNNFMRMARFVIKLMGYADEAIHMENFVIDPAPPPPLISDKSPKRVTIRWKNRVFHFTVTYPTSILQAALNNGIQLPYSCRGGRCSTCTIKCVSGKVKFSINEVLTDKDLEKGLILTCVGYAETDVELEL